MFKIIVVMLIWLTQFWGQVSAQPSVDSLMANNGCINCHGTSGLREGGIIPSIAGQPQAYLVQTLTQYRNGSLKGTIMNRVMERVDEEHVRLLADIFSAISVKVRLTEDTHEALGESIYQRQCGGCHEDKAEFVPRLRGQNIEYIRAVLYDLQKGRRTMSTDMTAAVSSLSDTELQSVLAYLENWTLELDR
jgi:cytochrome c553